MVPARYIASRFWVITLGALFAADHMTAQSERPIEEQRQAEDHYANILARVQQGDMSVDFRAFRLAGALRSGPHASKLETDERAAFRNIAASGDWAGALDLAKRALERNYASSIAQYDAMAAYQALGRQMRQLPTRRSLMRCLSRFVNPVTARIRRRPTSWLPFRKNTSF